MHYTEKYLINRIMFYSSKFFQAELIMKQQHEAIARVRELHKQILNECWSCLDENGLGIKYPCDTIKALDGEQ